MQVSENLDSISTIWNRGAISATFLKLFLLIGSLSFCPESATMLQGIKGDQNYVPIVSWLFHWKISTFPRWRISTSTSTPELDWCFALAHITLLKFKLNVMALLGDTGAWECGLFIREVFQLNFLPVLICVPPGSSNGDSGLGWAQHSKQLFKEGQKNTVTLEPWSRTWKDMNSTGRTAKYAIQLWYLELHDSPLELKWELQYLDENCHIRGEKMTILV